LVSRDLFALEGRVRTTPIPFRQPLAAYIESFHSRNGFSRDRMGAQAAAFDAQLTALVQSYVPADKLSFHLVADIVWGRPSTLAGGS